MSGIVDDPVYHVGFQRGEVAGRLLLCILTASLKVMKIFSHLQTRDQSQKVQNDKSSRGNVEPKIFVGGNGIFSIFSF